MLDYLPTITPLKYKDEMWFPLSPIFFPTIAPEYQISTWGRIYNNCTGQLIPNEFYEDGNRYITAYLHTISGPALELEIHRIMMYVFKNDEYNPNLEVNHKDGIKYHNWIWNLEMNTPSQNKKHAHVYGLAGVGENAYQSTITDDQAKTIASMVIMNIPLSNIEKSLKSIMPGVNVYSIAQTMQRGIAWNDIMEQMRGELTSRNKINKFSDEQIEHICQILENRGVNLSTKDILIELGYEPRSFTDSEIRALNHRISRIRTRTAHTKISSKYTF